MEVSYPSLSSTITRHSSEELATFPYSAYPPAPVLHSASSTQPKNTPPLTHRESLDSERQSVSVYDDGGGIPAGSDAKGGQGLNIMQYRAGLIGATLTVESPKEGGTVVTCVLPPRHCE